MQDVLRYLLRRSLGLRLFDGDLHETRQEEMDLADLSVEYVVRRQILRDEGFGLQGPFYDGVHDLCVPGMREIRITVE